jgi:hypothetical protein
MLGGYSGGGRSCSHRAARRIDKKEKTRDRNFTWVRWGAGAGSLVRRAIVTWSPPRMIGYLPPYLCEDMLGRIAGETAAR